MQASTGAVPGNNPPWEDGQGWRVLDPDGNVIDSGPVTVLEETSGLEDGPGG